MAEPKTKPTQERVKDFLSKMSDDDRSKDCQTIVKLMSEATGSKPEMWGPSIVGFGRHIVQYAKGREAEWMVIGFSPRKNDLTLYLGGLDKQKDLMKQLGKHRTGKGCLYIKKLEDVDTNVLRELIERSVTAKGSGKSTNKSVARK